MAKRTCDPTSGSIGSQVYGIGRQGQFVRARVIPANPNTDQQKIARGNLLLASKAWDNLTDAQRATWRTDAKNYMSAKRLGTNGELTGSQHHLQVNAALLEQGSALVTAPPAAQTFDALTPAALTASVAAGVLTLSQAWTGALPAGTRVLAAAPVKQGVNRQPGLVDLGAAPALVGSACVLSAAYTARFGVPPVGSRVFLAFRQTKAGLYGAQVPTNAIVTTGA